MTAVETQVLALGQHMSGRIAGSEFSIIITKAALGELLLPSWGFTSYHLRFSEPRGGVYGYLHFMEKENQAQRAEGTGPTLHSFTAGAEFCLGVSLCPSHCTLLTW